MSNKELFNLYVVPNKHYIQNIIRHYARRNTDLVMSVVMEKLYRYIHTFNPEKSALKTWLYTVSKRYCFKMCQQANKMPLSDTLDTYLMCNGSYDSNAVLETIEDFKTIGKFVLSDRLYNALASLSDKKLEAILYYANGYTFEMISEKLNVNIETIKSRFYIGAKEALQAYKSNAVVQVAKKQVKVPQKPTKKPQQPTPHKSIKVYTDGESITIENWEYYFHSYKQALREIRK